MSIRLHLSLKQLLGAGHTIVETSKQRGYNSIMLGRLRVSVSEEKAFVDLHSGELTDIELPSELDRKLIESITSHYLFHITAFRRTGEYRYHDTTAVLDKTNVGKEYMYSLKITGMDLDEMQQLYRDVREGRIWPAVDYEAEMVPPPARHLRQLFAEAWAIIRRDATLRLRRA